MTDVSLWISEPAEHGYEPPTVTYHAHHDWTAPESIGYTLSRVMEAITGDDATSTPLLSEFVDPDALETLFVRARRRGEPTDAVTFRRDGWTIRIQRNGHIVVWTRE